MKIRPSLLLSVPAALLVLSLALSGCYRKAAPDVTPTAAAGAESAEEGTPDIQATAAANATLAAAKAGTAPAEAGEQIQPTTPPTVPPTPTTVPKPAPTAIPPTPASTPRPQPTVVTTAAPPPSGPTVHTVRPGENLFRIALRYGTTVEAIAGANGIANPAMIYVGQQLTIPAGSGAGSTPAGGESTYVVQPGDNLFRIALRYNMSYIYLAQYNGIDNPANIYVGQVLRIPPH